MGSEQTEHLGAYCLKGQKAGPEGSVDPDTSGVRSTPGRAQAKEA